MKNKAMKFAPIVILILFLAGCDNSAQYNEAIQTGLDYVAAEDYINAEVKFERALEVKPDDAHASALLDQTIQYVKVLNAFDEENVEEGEAAAQAVVDNTEGSRGLAAKAQNLLENPIENFTYDDFKGIYAAFEGEPHESAISYAVILSDTYYVTIMPDWMEYFVYYIQPTTIENSSLHFDYEPDYNEYQDMVPGSQVAELETTAEGKMLHIEDYSLYEISQDTLTANDLSISEYILNDF